ncbi:MAG: threonine synthase [Legionellales bacterium]|nr:threonine synthase [Legionellales bacterium]
MKINYPGLIAKYAEYLPEIACKTPISLYEGNTPLIELHRFKQYFNLNLTLYVKYEGLNPTGSFKDRGMTVAISAAKAQGQRAVICASTGNTSASASAYAARAGMQAFVLIPEGKIAYGKLAQAICHGATVLQLQGNFDDGMKLVKQLADILPLAIVNSINPLRLQGQKTAAFEVCETLERAPDYHYLPVGNAGNISAYWMGYSELFHANKITQKPHMIGYQARGANALVTNTIITHPETIASAIRIGNPQSRHLALSAQAESSGWFNDCEDEDILQTQYQLAALEGIFCEPASAVSLAGVVQDYRAGKIPPHSLVVATLTGHGLKDPDSGTWHAKHHPTQVVPVELSIIRDTIEKKLEQ